MSELFNRLKKKILGDNFKESVRDYAVTLIVGSQGFGKSALMATLAAMFGNLNRVLILDVAGARGFKRYPTVTLEQFEADAELPKGHPKKWTKGVRKIQVLLENQDDILKSVAENYKDGYLFIDELAQTHKRAGDMSGWGAKVFLQCRNNRLDVIVAVHKFKDVHSAYRGHIKCIHIFATPEIIETPQYFRDLGYEDDINELFKLYKEAEALTSQENSIGQVFRTWYTKKFKAQLAAQKAFLKSHTHNPVLNGQQ